MGTPITPSTSNLSNYSNLNLTDAQLQQAEGMGSPALDPATLAQLQMQGDGYGALSSQDTTFLADGSATQDASSENASDATRASMGDAVGAVAGGVVSGGSLVAASRMARNRVAGNGTRWMGGATERAVVDPKGNFVAGTRTQRSFDKLNEVNKEIPTKETRFTRWFNDTPTGKKLTGYFDGRNAQAVRVQGHATALAAQQRAAGDIAVGKAKDAARAKGGFAADAGVSLADGEEESIRKESSKAVTKQYMKDLKAADGTATSAAKDAAKARAALGKGPALEADVAKADAAVTGTAEEAKSVGQHLKAAKAASKGGVWGFFKKVSEKVGKAAGKFTGLVEKIPFFGKPLAGAMRLGGKILGSPVMLAINTAVDAWKAGSILFDPNKSMSTKFMAVGTLGLDAAGIAADCVGLEPLGAAAALASVGAGMARDSMADGDDKAAGVSNE